MTPRQNACSILGFHALALMFLRGSAFGDLAWPGLAAVFTASNSPNDLWQHFRHLQKPYISWMEKEFQEKVLTDFQKLLEGFSRYILAPQYTRDDQDLPVLCQMGTTSLRDYGAKYNTGKNAVPVVFVPSLINRGYILDLLPGYSLFEYISSHGFRPLLADWQEPGREERRFGIEEYIKERLIPLLEKAEEITGQMPVVAGYCMGGTLLIHAMRYYSRARGIALLSVPWDFNPWQQKIHTLKSSLPFFHPDSLLNNDEPISPFWLQLFFHSMDLSGIGNKFSHMLSMAEDGDEFKRFVAMEDWVNDGVALSANVARELAGISSAEEIQNNNTKNNLTGLPATKINCPVLMIIPKQDRIVPASSSEALARQIPHASMLCPSLGHTGMIVSRNANAMVWEPIVKWMKGLPEK